MWSDVDVSAYIDGQLDPAALSKFEATLEKDQALQYRVDAMREVVTLVRAVPLREPPRNYLLTPAMVAVKPAPRPVPRRPALLMMRLATSLAAVAFVLTAGLNFLNQNLSPRAMVMPAEGIVQAPMAVEVTQQVELLVAAPPEAPAPESAPAEVERAEKAVPPQAELESAPAPAAEFAAPAATVAPAIAAAEAITAPAGMGEGVVGGTEAEVLADAASSPEPATLDAAQNGVAPAAADEESPAEAQEVLTYGVADDDAVREPARKAGVLSWWIPGILGAATLCLAGLTFWMSRRR